LSPGKLHTRFAAGVSPEGPLAPRRYTLTHSDSTGDLFLTVGPEVDRKQISGWYTRLMRDEVLAEWQESEEGPALHVFCHVSGGLSFGSAAMRFGIFQRELPLVLEAFRFGDRAIFEALPELDRAPVWVHFHSTDRRYHKKERWGTPAQYRLGGCEPHAG
jgi:Staygreen protein